MEEKKLFLVRLRMTFLKFLHTRERERDSEKDRERERDYLPFLVACPN